MAFAIKATLQAVQSYLMASGYFSEVSVGEPKQPVEGELTAALFMSSATVAELTLATTIELHVATIRVYGDMLREPTEEIEFGLAEVVQDVGSDLLGEYDLGATIRNVDAGGQYGTPMSTNWGHVEVSGKMYRIADITLPLIVDDSATFAA
tara:strand:- start:2194 stop:2646 length:453 start_codon:yes stop_codon:yes gene_type:complete